MAAEFLPGNRLTLLNSGGDYFPALLAAIGEAQTEIYLESYIFADDEIGHEVASALCQAAERGVLVNVTVDGFGARNFAADFLPMLTSAGVRAMYYRPEIGRFHLKHHRLRRLCVGKLGVKGDDGAGVFAGEAAVAVAFVQQLLRIFGGDQVGHTILLAR